jgi:REP element-mobilizing transposase RayT
MRRAQVVVYVHLVWATWDRLPLLTGAVKRMAYRAIGAACEEMEATVVAQGGVEDHVHLLVRLPATLSVAALVKQIKGSSGHLLASEASESGGFFKWQGSYGAFSVSPGQVAVICDYIARQEEHHRLGSLVAEWEDGGEYAGG